MEESKRINGVYLKADTDGVYEIDYSDLTESDEISSPKIFLKRHCKQDEYYFIYDTYNTNNEGNKLFGSSYLSKQDLLSMFDSWAEKSTIESFTGQPFDAWIESFPNCVYDMVQYYGTDNIFGTDYNPQPIHILI